jgi:hypothetical protein
MMKSDQRRQLASRSSALAKLHRRIWQLHDDEDFTGLRPTANELYLALGWLEPAASEAALLLTDAYRLADQAEMATSRTDEREIYKTAAKKLCNIRRLLGRREFTGRLEAAWWKAFRHKQVSKSFFILFGSLFLTKPEPISAMRAAYFMHNAARFHSDRDWDLVDVWLDRYWLEASKRRGPPLMGGI